MIEKLQKFAIRLDVLYVCKSYGDIFCPFLNWGYHSSKHKLIWNIRVFFSMSLSIDFFPHPTKNGVLFGNSSTLFYRIHENI